MHDNMKVLCIQKGFYCWKCFKIQYILENSIIDLKKNYIEFLLSE